MGPYIALIRNDVRLAFRQKAVIFFNYLLPLIFFFLFAQTFRAQQGGAILQVVTMVVVIGTLGNGLFGAGMRAVQERETNILRRYKVAPISPLPLLAASTVTGLLIYFPNVLLMFTIAHFRYGMAWPQNPISVFLFIGLGVVAIRSIGLIIASVVNSMQESTILVQLVYMSMLFLSGATFPTSMFPAWLLTVTQFIPAAWLITGMQGILMRHESLFANWQSVLAMVVTTVLGLLLCVKLFRWEKEEKLRPAAKFWVLAVIAPFVILGGWQTYAKDNIRKTKMLSRDLARSGTVLIRNARIVVGNGRVIENGAVLVKGGKIEEVYDGNIPEPEAVHAGAIEAGGKTIMPGLIDMHVHLGSPGGIVEDWTKVDPTKTMERELAAYLYSGVTAVKSVGDILDAGLKLRQTVNSGEKLGAEFFLTGPLFTAAGGHGTEYFRAVPEPMRQQMEARFVRIPKDAADVAMQVAELRRSGVDGIKAVMEGGVSGMVFNRLDPLLLNAIATAARDNHLPIVVHTGEARDVQDALHAGVNGIEHGSLRDRISDEVFAQMAMKGITYDPTLSVGEAFPEFAAGKTELLNRSLVQQTAPRELLAATRKFMSSADGMKMRQSLGQYPMRMESANENLLHAWKMGVPLITGTDAGNMLVIHGPTVQHELELWVAAGIPPAVAIQAATLNSAKALGAATRFGSVEKGKEATLLVVDGNPLEDIRAVGAISFVMFKGERLNRADLFDQK